MTIALHQLGQVSLTVDDVDKAEQFYAGVLGLRKLYRFGDMVFFDCAGVRLYIQKSIEQPLPSSSVLYFRTPDISIAVREPMTSARRFFVPAGRPSVVSCDA